MEHGEPGSDTVLADNLDAIATLLPSKSDESIGFGRIACSIEIESLFTPIRNST
jgi:hypothetical protein